MARCKPMDLCGAVERGGVGFGGQVVEDQAQAIRLQLRPHPNAASAAGCEKVLHPLQGQLDGACSRRH